MYMKLNSKAITLFLLLSSGMAFSGVANVDLRVDQDLSSVSQESRDINQSLATLRIEIEKKTKDYREDRKTKETNITVTIATLLFFLALILIIKESKKSSNVRSEARRVRVNVEARGKEEANRIKSIIKAEAKVRADVKAKEDAILEAKTQAIIKAEAKVRADVKAKEDAILEAKTQAIVKAREKFESDLINLHNSLPFFTSNSSDEFSSTNGDNSRWYQALEAIKKCDRGDTILYFVKVKNLNDDNEYYQIGVTTLSIISIFRKSTNEELIEIIASHVMEKRLALFAEFHFIREFRPTEAPYDESKLPGHTKIVKENSINKIKSLFATLPEYEAKASSFLSKALTDQS